MVGTVPPPGGQLGAPAWRLGAAAAPKPDRGWPAAQARRWPGRGVVPGAYWRVTYRCGPGRGRTPMRIWLKAAVATMAALVVAGLAGAAPAGAAAAVAPGSFCTYTGSTPLAQEPPGTVLKTRTLYYHVVGIMLPIRVVQLLYRSAGPGAARRLTRPQAAGQPAPATAPAPPGSVACRRLRSDGTGQRAARRRNCAGRPLVDTQRGRRLGAGSSACPAGNRTARTARSHEVRRPARPECQTAGLEWS